jgi:hypothetical protein
VHAAQIFLRKEAPPLSLRLRFVVPDPASVQFVPRPSSEIVKPLHVAAYIEMLGLPDGQGQGERKSGSPTAACM